MRICIKLTEFIFIHFKIYFYTSRVKVRMYFYKYGPIGTFLWFSVSIFVPILFWP